jgi:hypothetical protein
MRKIAKIPAINNYKESSKHETKKRHLSIRARNTDKAYQNNKYFYTKISLTNPFPLNLSFAFIYNS